MAELGHGPLDVPAHSVADSPVGPKNSIQYTLPPNAVQGDPLWYAVDLHVEVGAIDGPVSAEVSAETNGRTFALISLGAGAEDDKVVWSSSNLLEGVVGGFLPRSGAPIAFRNHLQVAGVVGGQNEMSFSVTTYDGLPAPKVRVLPATRLSMSPDDPLEFKGSLPPPRAGQVAWTVVSAGDVAVPGTVAIRARNVNGRRDLVRQRVTIQPGENTGQLVVQGEQDIDLGLELWFLPDGREPRRLAGVSKTTPEPVADTKRIRWTDGLVGGALGVAGLAVVAQTGRRRRGRRPWRRRRD